MKLKLLCSLFIFVTFFSSQAQTTYPSGVTGCIARWDFSASGSSDSLLDVSGNGHNGIMYDLTDDAGFRGIANAAMSFNGTTSYAEVQNDSQLSPQQVTMIALVKLDTFYSGLCQGNQIYSKGWPYYLTGDYEFQIEDNTYDNSCNIYSPNNEQMGNDFSTISSYTQPVGNYINLHEWYFLACSYDGNILKNYQVLMDTSDYHATVSPIFTSPGLATPIGYNSFDATIGNHLNPSYPYWFAGSMDELVLFNKVLSDSEVQSVYHYLWGSSLGVTNINTTAENNFQIYPNPSTGNFVIEGSINAQNEASIEIRNLLGQIVYSDHAQVVNNRINKQISLNETIANGVYLLSIYSDQQMTTQRLIINR